MTERPATIDISFLRNRKAQVRIVLITGAFALAGLIYGLVASKWYRSVLTVVPAKSSSGGGLSSILSGELAGLAAGLADSAAFGADVHRITAVLHSNDVSDAVIAKFELMSRYKSRSQEEARDALWNHCELKTLPKPSLVELSCEDKDPRFAQQLLQYFAEYGNQVFRRVGVSSASEQVRFLEKHVSELRAQADEAAARMRDFQEKHQIVDLDTQARAVVSAMASLNSNRITKQMELDYARTFASRDESTTRQLASQLAVVDRNLRSLESEEQPVLTDRATKQRLEHRMFPAALAVPKLRAEYETLYRDRKVAEATLIFSLERLESAKADAARNTSTFLVLDPPALPTRKSRPRRLIILVSSAALGLVAALVIEWTRSGGLNAALSNALTTAGRG
jgi:capsule polysaccharide export protein KpsE/RkpR